MGVHSNNEILRVNCAMKFLRELSLNEEGVSFMNSCKNPNRRKAS